ncbi:ferredoxin [Verrucomicrobiales bacterium]|jgi:ferredoxin|nr:ferredoxin [Verrucomicrobiales bacterium]|tara:strand:- start:79 stop:363 length:285 start_codon:yes stop_codon:yes gene_type:complete
MAEYQDRYEENAPGRFYVDDTCIDCDQCRQVAPDFFTRQDKGGYSYVKKQPVTPEEVELCEEAFDGCPTDTIGDDGPEITPRLASSISVAKISA